MFGLEVIVPIVVIGAIAFVGGMAWQKRRERDKTDDEREKDERDL